MDFDLLKKLCQAHGVPGREDRLREIVMDALRPMMDEVKVDVLGNVIGHRSGPADRKVMMAAHMDEIGFLVKFITKKGFLRLQPLGGFDPRQLFAQRVLVHTERAGPLRGILSYTTKPTHLLEPEERNKAPKIENFFVDLGRPVDEVKSVVRVGDMVTMDRNMESCGDGLMGKAVDDRVGLFVMIEALRMLKESKVDLYAVATAQEEIGLRGATTAAYTVAPHIGIALDTTLANDYPGVQEHDAVTELGKGVAIKIMDSSVLSHPRLVEHFRDVAARNDIPHQMEILPRGGTDAGALQRSREGSVSITLSVPTRYIHTVNEFVHCQDVEAAVQLLAHYLEEAHERDYAY